MIENFDNFKKIFIAGVGGVGISAVARLLKNEGKEVSGSDIAASAITDELEKIGVKFQKGQDISLIPKDTDLVIYSIALDELDPGFMSALKEKFSNYISYPESLAIISKNKKTIAITGTHGKTTTTSMTAKAAIDAGLSPTVIVGSILKEWKSNFIAGDGPYFIVEGCEYRRSFLNLHPYILVITNIEADHLDYYKDLADIKNAFRELAERVPADGFIVCDPSDENVSEVVAGLSAKIVDYKKADLADAKLQMPGQHNLENAKAAFSVLGVLGAPPEGVKKSLADFSGVWRRFEYIGQTSGGAQVFDDYAHHPTEIRAFLHGARERFPDKKILAAFQPHLFSRTRDFLNDFAHSFSDADEVVLLPIYKAREKDTGEISSADVVGKLAEAGKKATLLEDFDKARDYILENTSADWVVATIGAGETNLLAEKLVK